MKASTKTFRRLGELPRKSNVVQSEYPSTIGQVSRLTERQLTNLTKQATQIVEQPKRCASKQTSKRAPGHCMKECLYVVSENVDKSNSLQLPKIEKRGKNIANKSQLVASWKKNKLLTLCSPRFNNLEEHVELPLLSNAATNYSSIHPINRCVTREIDNPESDTDSVSTSFECRLRKKDINLILASSRHSSRSSSVSSSSPPSSPTHPRVAHFVTENISMDNVIHFYDESCSHNIEEKPYRREKPGKICQNSHAPNVCDVRSDCLGELSAVEYVELSSIHIDLNTDRPGRKDESVVLLNESENTQIRTYSDTSGYESRSTPSDNLGDVGKPAARVTEVAQNPEIPHVIWRDSAYSPSMRFIYGNSSDLSPLIVPTHSTDCPLSRVYSSSPGIICPPNSPTLEFKKDYGFFPVQKCLSVK